MNDVSKMLAEQLESKLGIPVLAKGDDAIVDTPRCLIMEPLESCIVTLSLMSSEGLPQIGTDLDDIAATLRSTTLTLEGALKDGDLLVGPFIALGKQEQGAADAPYADSASMKLVFDIETRSTLPSRAAA